MTDIIDINKVRSDRERPDAEFIKRDDFGREMFCFSCAYKFDGGDWTFHLWAYDMADAESRVSAMNANGVTLDGMIHTKVPL
jgi:hypothetical protein